MMLVTTPLTMCLCVALECVETTGQCVCKDATLRGGWCEACRLGYVAGLRITSSDLFEALDAHGHTIQPDRIACQSCQAALKTDGYCELCGMGFVKQQAYLSQLAYHLALGEITDPKTIFCIVCRELAGKRGWCGNCRQGWIGYAAFRNHDDYQRAFKFYGILVDAVATLSRCEICAIAMVTNARCLTCKVAYKDGKPVGGPLASPERGIIVESECDQSRAREEAVPK